MKITKLLLSLVLVFLVSISTFAVNPKHEVRAVWLTTIGGLDWPHSYAQSAASIERQQNELRDILDKLKRANINTILLQTRIRATAIFPTNASSFGEPWDGCLSGHPGTSPGYDALQFAIGECHRRGMELHAWVVTIPVGKWDGYGCRELRKRHADMLIKIGDEGYMDPADNRTAQYLASYCADITRRYDIDGIHLDYIRYPESMKKLPKAAEGRRNITRIVTAIHDSVKAQKPWVRMSCSPVGKHDDTQRFWSHGWNARSRVFQDAKEWMRLGLMDMEFPMMYFRGNNFYPFAIDWQEGSYGKTMVPGLGIYFLHPKEANWKLEDITRELYVLRDQGMGFCMFRSKFFTDNVKGLYDFVSQQLCPYPSLVTPMHGAKGKAPAAPRSLKVLPGDKTITVVWQEADATGDARRPTGQERDKAGRDDNDDYLTYNVYFSDTYPVDVTRAENILVVRHRGTMLTVPSTAFTAADGSALHFYAVTAVDRYGRESKPCQQPGVIVPEGVKPGWYWVTHPLGR